MLDTLLGMVMEVKQEQPSKALFPILVTLLGMVMEVRLVHPWKALSPILVTLVNVSISMTVPRKASPISVMELGRVLLAAVSPVLFLR